jgi:tRNA threonylcarbamoyladenosine biosynthesis protein TsaB
MDTATAATAVALVELDHPRAAPAAGAAATLRAAAPQPTAGLVLERRDDPPPGARPRHTTRLLELVDEVMSTAGLHWDDLDRLAVGIGPGTFTGLRIGIATARALSVARALPLVGVSTLASLALGAAIGAPEDGSLVAVLDARRGEAFAAAWRSAAPPPAEPVRAPAALAPAALAAAVQGLAAPLAVGDGAVAFRELLQDAEVTVPADESPLHRVSAAVHCRLAAVAGAGGAVAPEYLRRPDAEVRRA